MLQLCLCLLTACGSARKQVVSVHVLDSEQLRDLIIRKQIDAYLADGAQVGGRVEKVGEGLVSLDIEKSSRPAVPRGVHEIPLDRISTVQFTRYESNSNRVSYATFFCLGGIVLAAGLGAGGSAVASTGILLGTGTLGYLWGRNKDKQNITVKLEHPPRIRKVPTHERK